MDDCLVLEYLEYIHINFDMDVEEYLQLLAREKQKMINSLNLLEEIKKEIKNKSSFEYSLCVVSKFREYYKKEGFIQSNFADNITIFLHVMRDKF